MSLTDAIRQWWHDMWAEPTEIGVEGRMKRRGEPGYQPTTAAPGRMMFPAPGWSVPKDGPNAQGEPRAVQLYPKLCEYEWDILFDAAELPTPTGKQVIAGAAYNECATFLAKSGITGLMGKPTDLGRQLIAMRQRRVDVV